MKPFSPFRPLKRSIGSESSRGKRFELAYLTYGVVVKLDDLWLQTEAGFTQKFPRWAIAQASLSYLMADSEAVARDSKVEEAIQGFKTTQQCDPNLKFDPVFRAKSISEKQKAATAKPK